MIKENTNLHNGQVLGNMQEFFLKSAMAWQSYESFEFIKEKKLSPAQNVILNSESKAMLINGSAGSGKSLVLVYKLLKYMLEESKFNNSKKFLYVTYNQTLVDYTLKTVKLYDKFDKLRSKHKAVDICTFHNFATKILKNMGFNNIEYRNINYKTINKMRSALYRKVAAILCVYKEGGEKFDTLPRNERLYEKHDEGFIRDEILWMKANGYITLESYLNCDRIGRGNTPRLEKSQRKTIFKIFNDYVTQCEEEEKWNRRILDLEDDALVLLKKINEINEEEKYDYIFVDEVQDFDAMQLKLLANMYKRFFVLSGDPKQKIYKRCPHNYINLGIDIRNSCKNLYENYRSTKEIMKLANSLEFTDIIKDSSKIKYNNSGEKPVIFYCNDWNIGMKRLVKKINSIHSFNSSKSVCIVTREEEKIANGNESRIKQKLEESFSLIDINDYSKKFNLKHEKQIVYTDLYNVKGLEFDYVFILHFDNKHYPNMREVNDLEKHSINQLDEKDKKELINVEKKRLYVAMSRAKEYLEMICVSKTPRGISNFMKDFNKDDYVYICKEKRM